MLGITERPVPSVEIDLLRAHVKRHAIGMQAKRIGMTQNIDRHGRRTPELAGERPFSAFTIGQYAAEDARAGSSAGYLVDFLDCIDREQANAELIGARNIAFFLNGVAKRDAVSRRTGIHRHFDLNDRGCVKA